MYLWSDSTIVLSQIKTPAHRLKTFVANRIAEIQEKSDVEDCNWISTFQNPDDLISRGCFQEQLVENDMRWNGPNWLINNETEWPIQKDEMHMPEEILELKP